MKEKKTRARSSSFASNMVTYGIVIVAFLLVELAQSGAIKGFSLSRSLRGQLVPICVYIVMAVSLNLTVGISGELSLGHAGFMSIGAFSGVVASQYIYLMFPDASLEVLRILAALLAGCVVSGIAGALVGIPVLRLRGDYLAIVTLAFGEIIRNLLNCVYLSYDGGALHFGFLNASLPGTMLISGPLGATGVKRIASFEAGFLLVLFALFVTLNLIDSRSGRAIMAIRDNRIAAESVGISITKYKMMAFVTSAALAGMAGALYALNFSSTQASKFKFDTSILVLVFVVLGGIGSIRGSVIAATVLTVLPEMLREFGNYRMLVYAIVLILVMLLTNSPTLKQAMGRLIPHRHAKEDERT